MSEFHRGDRVLRHDPRGSTAWGTVIGVDPNAADWLLVDLDQAPVVLGLDVAAARWPLSEAVLIRRGSPIAV